MELQTSKYKITEGKDTNKFSEDLSRLLIAYIIEEKTPKLEITVENNNDTITINKNAISMVSDVIKTILKNRNIFSLISHTNNFFFITTFISSAMPPPLYEFSYFVINILFSYH